MSKHCFLLLIALSFFPAKGQIFQDKDTIVLLGNTVVERAQKYGHLETALTLASDKSNLKFRNLGWSGDTVFGTARSYFGPPQEGFDRLTADLTELKANVVIICYGASAAFDGGAGLAQFISGYERLLAMVKSSAAPREIIIVSPPPAESLAAPMPDMTAHNKNLALYSQALSEMAKKHQLHFADLFSTLGPPTAITDLTDNGLHFTEKGYQTIASKFPSLLGLTPASDTQLKSENASLLRKEIIAKNKLFFFRWRPANETYLRLFRKHEQGKNAQELPMFDPLIAEREKEIQALKTSILASK